MQQLTVSAINPNPPSTAVNVSRMGRVSCRTFWPCIILRTGNHQSLPLHDCHTSPIPNDSMHKYPRTSYYVTNAAGIGSFPIRPERQDYQLKSSFLRIAGAFRRSRHFQITQSRNRAFVRLYKDYNVMKRTRRDVN